MEILILLLSIPFAYSGHISSFPILNHWQNAKYVEKITLHFSLENSISESDYVKVESPLDLGIVKGKIRLGSSINDLSVTKVGTNVYFFSGVQFLAHSLYTLEITLGTKPTTSGTQGIFKLETTSGTVPQSLTYDSNAAFAIWTLAPEPSTTSLTVGNPIFDTAAASTKNNPGAVYDLTIDITSGVDSTGFSKLAIIGGSQFQGRLTSTEYSVISCQFETKICLATEANCKNIAIPDNNACVPTNSTSGFHGFVATVNSNVQKTQQFRIGLKLRNTVNPSVSTNIDVWHTSFSHSIIWEIRTGTPFASVSKITSSLTALKTLWSMTYSQTKPCPTGFYQPSGTSSNNVPTSNNLYTEFTFDKTITGVELGIKVSLGPKTIIGGILEGSIMVKGMSPMPNQEIICAPNYPSSDSDLLIVCRGIGSVSASTTYGIGARLYGTAYTTGGNQDKYPKVELHIVTSTGSIPLSTIGELASGYTLYKNNDMVALSSSNAGSFKDSNGIPIMGSSWVFSLRRNYPSSFAPISYTEVLSVLCLRNTGSATDLYATPPSPSCSQSYYYGVFKDKSGANFNSLFLLINGAGFSSQSFNSVEMPKNDFKKNTHIVHKFMFHKDFMTSSSILPKKFGMNLVGNILGNSASGGSVSCSKTGASGTYCYPSFDNSDTSFADGVFTATNTDKIYLFNKFDNTATDYAVVTITCVPNADAASDTDSKISCAFRGASRTQNNVTPFPGFEFISDEATISKVSKSSIYPDERVNDWAYCLYTVSYTSIGTDAVKVSTLKTEDDGTTGIKRRLQALFNWFHLDIPSSSNDLSTAIYFLNGNCLEDSSAGNAFTMNDGAHLPLLLRIQYKFQNTQGTFDAAALFFTHQGGLSFSVSDAVSGTFGNYNKGSKANDLQPHELTSNFYSIASSNKAKTTTKVNAKGYSLSSDGNILESNLHNWNYQKYVLFDDASMENDFYVQIKAPSSVNDAAKCQQYFKIQTAVLAFLKKKQGTQYFDVQDAYVIYSTLKYSGSNGYYSSKYSFNLGDLLPTATKVAASNLKWNSYTLADVGNCASVSDMYPISTDYKIGVESKLAVEIKTGTSNLCKTVNFFNGNYPGSAITLSYLSSPLSPVTFIKGVSLTTNPLIDTTSCANMITATGIASYTQASKPLNLETFICPFKGTSNLDLSTGSTSLEIELTSTVPWFWGIHTSSTPTSILQQLYTQGWSLNGVLTLGVGQKYTLNKPGNALVTDSCIASAYSPIQLSTNTQKITWDFTNSQSNMVLPTPMPIGNRLVTNAEQALIIQDDIGSLGPNIEVHECVFPVNGLQCSVALSGNTIVYTVQATSADSPATVNKGSGIRIVTYASYSGPTEFQIKHKTSAHLFLNTNTVNSGNSRMKILDCGAIGTDVSSTAARPKAIAISGIKFSVSNKVMAPFEFSFSFPAGIGFYQVTDPNAIVRTKIFMGSLYNSNEVATNVKCAVLKSSGEISSDFSKITIVGPDWYLDYKAYTDNAGTYKFKCSGGLSPSLYSTPMTITAESNKGTLGTGTSPLTSSSSSPISVATATAFNSTNKFNSAGMAVILKFNLVLKSNVTYDSFFYFFFPTSFSPKLSTLGKVTCRVQDILVDCYFLDDWLLAVNPPQLYEAGILIKVSIDGVVLPSSYSTYSKIVFQLDSDRDLYNGVSEHIEIDSPAINAIATSNSQIPVFHYSVSSTFIRETVTHRLYIKLPASTVQVGKYLYIDFGDLFSDSLKSVDSFNFCSMFNEYQSATNNLAQSCTKIEDRLVRIALNTDTVNSVPQIYKLEIGAMNTPQNPFSFSCAPLIFLADVNETKVLTFSDTGYYNATCLDYKATTSKLLLNWQSSDNKLMEKAIVNKGYFSSKFSLNYPSPSLSTGLIVSKSGTFASYFSLFQEGQDTGKLTLASGSSSASFQMSANENFTNGFALLSWNKTSDDVRSGEVAILPVSVRVEKCQIAPSILNSNIATSTNSSTSSLPIIIDFSNCIPNGEIQVSANLTVNTDSIFSLSKSSYNVSAMGDGSKRIAGFIVNAKIAAAASKSATVSFSLQGIVAKYFTLSPSSITLNTGGIVTSLPSPDPLSVLPLEGTASLIFSCNEMATIYWKIGVNITEPTMQEIKNATLEKGMSKSRLNVSDPLSSIVGFSVQSSASNKVNITFNEEVKSGHLYRAYGFCMGQATVTPPVLMKEWNQTNNGAKIAFLKFNLSALPTENEANSILNAICSFIQAKPGQVHDQSGKPCTNTVKRILQVTNNNSIAVNTTNGTDYYVILIPDLFATNNSKFSSKLSLLEGKKLTEIGANNLSLTEFGNSTIVNLDYPLKTPILDANASKINTNLSVWNNSIMTVKADNECFFYGCVFFKNETIPTLVQIKKGENGNKTACQVKVLGYFIPKNTSTNVELKYLQEKTEYQLAFSLASINIGSADTQFTNVKALNFTSKSMNFAFMKAAISILLLLFAALI